MRIRRPYNTYAKDTLPDEKFSRRKFEVDLELKKSKEKSKSSSASSSTTANNEEATESTESTTTAKSPRGGGGNNFTDMTQKMKSEKNEKGEKVDCDPALIQDSFSDVSKLIVRISLLLYLLFCSVISDFCYYFCIGCSSF